MVAPSPPDALTGVIFDFHGTLVDAHEPAEWIADARRWLADRGRPVPPVAGNPALARYLYEIWTHADAIDPASVRDLDRERHRDVFVRTMALYDSGDSPVTEGLTEALYAVMPL